MQVTYTRSYLQQLCKTAVEKIYDYRKSLKAKWVEKQVNELIVWECLSPFAKIYTSKPIDIFDAPVSYSWKEYSAWGKKVTLYRSALNVYDDISDDCVAILCAIEQSQDTEFKLDYELAAAIKEAAGL